MGSGNLRAMGLRVETGCRTGKVGYQSRKAAHRGARLLGRHYGKGYVAYTCPHCRMFHLATRRESR